MPKYYFQYESEAPVGNKFQEIWGNSCPKSRDGLSCPACEKRLYHYYTGTVLQTLHIWTGRVVIRQWAWNLKEMEFVLGASKVVFHSDYTLEHLRHLSLISDEYQTFINQVVERS